MSTDNTGTKTENKAVKHPKKTRVDGQTLKRLTEAGFIWLKTNQKNVNALNVFPVPDGDTGTNMVLTMQAAWDEIKNSPDREIGKIAHDIAHGALMGARGNSGVILSQIWRGFARTLDNHLVMDSVLMKTAFDEARDTAYKGVVRPVEGTILTVAKDAAKACSDAVEQTDDLVEILSQVIQEMDRSVQRTPELLDVLREAGVVDAGGKGLFFLVEGMLRHLQGLPLDTATTTVSSLGALDIEHSIESIEPGQDFEVVIDFQPSEPFNLERFYASLEEMGTSIQVGEGDGIYRMHIHVPTEKLYEPINHTMSVGTVTKAAIENLVAQMEEIERHASPSKLTQIAIEPGQIAVVAVAPGLGIGRVFASLGAAAIVEGGQTMNPSTQEIINAFENLPTDKVIILPNNKNIFLAAQAAVELTVKNVRVIPCRTVPQGLAAMLRLLPDGDLDKVSSDMISALDEVETGEITIATRSVEIDGVQVKEGNVIALHNGKLVLSTATLDDAVIALLEHAQTEEYELITLFSGSDCRKQDVDRVVDKVRSRFPEQVVEVQNGGQPHYPFIISIE